MTSIKKSQPTLNTMLKIKLTDKQKRATARAIEIQKEAKLPKYAGVFNMTYKVYNKKTKKMENVIRRVNALGTDNTLIPNARKEYRKLVKQFKEDYPENDSYSFSEIPLQRVFIPVSKTGSGTEVVSTSTTGGMRITKKYNKQTTKMREGMSGYFKTTNSDEVWNTRQGKCVFDYLRWKYNTKKQFSKGQKKAEEFLEQLFIDDKNSIIEEPLQDGVSIIQLERFCDYFNISMYAYDKGNNLISSYKPKKIAEGIKSGGAALIFVMYDNHFNPIEDKYDRDCKVKRAIQNGFTNNNIETKLNSNDIEIKKDKKQKDIQKKIIIAPTEEEFKSFVEAEKDKDYINAQNRYALYQIRNREGEIPFPINPKSVYITDGTIQQLSYDNTIIITKPINPYVKRYYGDEYQGEHPISITREIWERMYGMPITEAPFLSNTNKQVSQTLNAEGVKYRTHLGNMSEGKYLTKDIGRMLISGEAVAVDITKCYADCLYNQKEDFIVFNGKEVVRMYDGNPLTLGLYFIETEDLTLFHKNNWYSRAIIEYAFQEGIEFQITRQIRCVDEWSWNSENEQNSLSLNQSSLFKDFIDKVVEETIQDGDYTLTKLVINTLSGLMGKTNSNIKEVGLCQNMDELWDDFLVPNVEKNPDVKLHLNTLKDEEINLYIYGFETKSKNLTNGLPIYLQILDWSNINLHKLGKKVGGEVIYRKVDCIVSVGGSIPIDMLEDKSKPYVERFGTYHQEDLDKALHFNFDFDMNKTRGVVYPKIDPQYTDYPFHDSNDWSSIVNTAIEKGGMLIVGRAGTGKTWVIDKAVQGGLLPSSVDTRIAFTNRAARNINGSTIHKTLAINMSGKTNNKTLVSLKKHNVMVIDEGGMINADMWHKLALLKEKTGITFIVLADHRQLPPIENGLEVNYLNHPFVKRLVGFNRCELTTPQRYDMTLWRWLEDFYERGIVGTEIQKVALSNAEILNTKNICYTNKTRTRINNLCMDYMIDKTDLFIELKVPEKCSNDRAENIYIYNDLPVMCVANNKTLNTINSEEFIVVEFSPLDETIMLKNIENPDDELLKVDFKLFHNNFVCNYCSTTHKAQGATIEKPIVIFDWKRMMNDERIGYTAVSRATTCEQVRICYNL